MKLRNKKTLKVVDAEIKSAFYEDIAEIKLKDKKTGAILGMYNSLAELNAEWEDYEEPKEFWFIDASGEVQDTTYITHNDKSSLRKFGNYFDTREEAERAVDKLKAWKRLKDKGFKFVGWEDINNDVNDILFEFPYMEWDKNVSDDLDLLFGEER